MTPAPHANRPAATASPPASNAGRLRQIEPLVLWALLVLWLLSLATAAINDGDVWFHLASGRYTFEHGRPPSTDPFTFSSAGREYICLHWLFQVCVYGLYRVWGTAGLVLCQAVLVLGVFAVFAAAAGLRRTDGALLVLAGVVMACSGTLTVRPTLVSLILLLAFLWIWRRGRGFWLYPALQLLWVNCHGLFILGPFVVGAWSLVAMRKRLPYLVLTCLACFLNPYGLRGVLFPLTLATRITDRNVYSRNILELASASENRFFLGHPAGWACLALLLGCVVGLVLAWRRGRRRDLLPLVVLLGGFGVLYLQAFRNVPLFAVVAGWSLCRLLPALVGWRTERSRLRWGVAAALALLPLGLRAQAAAAGYPRVLRGHAPVPARFGRSPYAFPAGAVQFLRSRQWRGRLFNDFNWGGYLIYHLATGTRTDAPAGNGDAERQSEHEGVASRGPAHSSDAAVALTPTPEPPVFIDPRLEVHSQELFAQVVRLTRDATVFLELDRGYHFDGAVFCHLPFRGLPDLFVLLREQPGWRLAYVDSIAAVFVRDRSDGRPAPDPAVVADVPPPPTESLPDLRARYLRGLSLAPWRPLPLAEVYPEIGWGHVQLYLGKREEALAVLLDAALRAPQIGDMHLFVAYVALRLGDRQLFERASGYLQAVQPRHPELGKLHLLARKLWPKPG